MSRGNLDIAKLRIDEIPTDSRDNEASPGSAALGENMPQSRNASPAPLDRTHEKSTSPRFADAHPTPSPRSHGTGIAASHASPTTGGNHHLRPAASSTSINSQTSQRSASSSTPGKSSRPLTPASSVLELKRFFGKGRTKHEHGVKPDEKKRQKPTFNLFGLGKKKGSRFSSPATTPSQEVPPSPQDPLNQEHQHSHNHHHNHHHHHEHHHDHKGFFRHHSPAQQDERPVVKSKPPGDLNPNFVVHGPDYEAEWDPFHVFGLAPNSERLPFLESGITKYGEVGRDMGSGAGGSVRMMERPSDKKLFAVKEFRPRRQNETPQKYAKHMTAEYALGAALHHRNIIQTIDLIKENDKYYEVMEYGPHDFFEVVMSGNMSTPQINSSFHQIVSGVAYLHSMGVAHRDLKLDNCVITDDGTVKLIDFGSAVVFKYPMSPQIHLARGILGSDPYLAPEVFLKHPYQPQCADVWSCGIIYCCTYLRRFPWKIPEKEDVSFRKFSENSDNLDGKHPPQDNPRKITGPWRLLRLLPRDSRAILARILKINVAERATVEEIQKDPWFSNIKEINVLPGKAS